MERLDLISLPEAGRGDYRPTDGVRGVGNRPTHPPFDGARLPRRANSRSPLALEGLVAYGDAGLIQLGR